MRTSKKALTILLATMCVGMFGAVGCSGEKVSEEEATEEELTEEEIKNVHEIADQIEKVDLIKDLMDKERNMNQLFSDVSQIIVKPIQELYKN